MRCVELPEDQGTSTWSNHASATAVDLNWIRHPYGPSGTFSAAQVRQIRAILAACEGTVRWGGDYTRNKDEMHFEINKRPGDPAIARVARKLGNAAPPPPPPPPAPAPSGWPTLRSGSRGFRVKALQLLLTQWGYRLVADGIFGSKTKAAVVAFQARKGLARDGIVGPRTWSKVIITVRRGSRGNAVNAVKAVQTSLNARGARLSVDGVAGSKTVAAIVWFQRRNGLATDGIVGPRTWNRLV